MTGRWFILSLLVVLVTAAGLRMARLDARPMHNDEAVNAIKTSTLWDTGKYAYDPHEFHGPTLPYLTLPFIWLSGADDIQQVHDRTLRLLPVVFGLGLIALLFPLRNGLGETATLCAAAFTALSPAFVFYSRYYIHEMLLVFFTLMLIVGGWRYSRTKHPAWAIFAGAGGGLMYATKETFVLSLAAMVCGLAGNHLWNNWRLKRTVLTDTQRLSREHSQAELKMLNWRHVALAAVSGLIVSQLLFTSFFANASGPMDSLRTYFEWMRRARGESVHAQSWGFYFERLLWFQREGGPLWSEGIILILATAGGWASFFGGPFVMKHAGLARFLTIYTVALAGIYTAITYKTPWCALGFWHGAILLAGIGAAALLQCAGKTWARWLVAILIVLGCAHLAIQSYRAIVSYPANPRNPYVYAHTSPNIRELIHKVESLAVIHVDKNQMMIKAISPGDDYWPLPWYLRNFERAGWWSSLPEDPFAPVMIVSTKLRAALDADGRHIMTGVYQLRPDAFLELYVETNLWSRFIYSQNVNAPP